jgi:hypothetical protein
MERHTVLCFSGMEPFSCLDSFCYFFVAVRCKKKWQEKIFFPAFDLCMVIVFSEFTLYTYRFVSPETQE